MPDRGGGGLTFHHLDTSFRLRERALVRSWIKTVASGEKKTLGHIAYHFCSDAHLLSINQTFLKHDSFTDIVTFDYSDADCLSGEIFISVDRVKDNARKFNATVKDELHRVMIHGVLHLCGFGDKTPPEKAVMTGKEDFCLSLRSF
jgi:rRNA maturation RNase YbeY